MSRTAIETELDALSNGILGQLRKDFPSIKVLGTKNTIRLNTGNCVQDVTLGIDSAIYEFSFRLCQAAPTNILHFDKKEIPEKATNSIKNSITQGLKILKFFPNQLNLTTLDFIHDQEQALRKDSQILGKRLLTYHSLHQGLEVIAKKEVEFEEGLINLIDAYGVIQFNIGDIRGKFRINVTDTKSSYQVSMTDEDPVKGNQRTYFKETLPYGELSISPQLLDCGIALLRKEIEVLTERNKGLEVLREKITASGIEGAIICKDSLTRNYILIEFASPDDIYIYPQENSFKIRLPETTLDTSNLEKVDKISKITAMIRGKSPQSFLAESRRERANKLLVVNKHDLASEIELE